MAETTFKNKESKSPHPSSSMYQFSLPSTVMEPGIVLLPLNESIPSISSIFLAMVFTSELQE